MKPRLIDRSKRLNGWQRLWSVLTILTLIVVGMMYPAWIAVDYKDRIAYEFNTRLVKSDYENDSCSAYINQPVGELCNPRLRRFGCEEQKPQDDEDIGRLVVEEMLADSESSREGSCLRIYNARIRDAELGRDVTPYTYEVFEQNEKASVADQNTAARWKFALGVLLLWVAIIGGSVLIYAVLYGVSLVAIWIGHGFREY